MYTIQELIRVARKVFDVNGALVEVALKQSGQTNFTLDEAKSIVDEFSKREVKK